MQKKSKIKLPFLKLNNASSLLFLMLNESLNTFLDSVMCKQSLCHIFFRKIIEIIFMLLSFCKLIMDTVSMIINCQISSKCGFILFNKYEVNNKEWGTLY